MQSVEVASQRNAPSAPNPTLLPQRGSCCHQGHSNHFIFPVLLQSTGPSSSFSGWEINTREMSYRVVRLGEARCILSRAAAAEPNGLVTLQGSLFLYCFPLNSSKPVRCFLPYLP